MTELDLCSLLKSRITLVILTCLSFFVEKCKTESYIMDSIEG